MKKLLAIILAVIMVLPVFVACNDDAPPIPPSNTGEPVKSVNDKQVFKFWYSELPDINYLSADWSDVAQLTVDGLVEFNKYGIIVPCLATDWSKSDDGLTYTFKLREGVQWYTNEGRPYAEVVADDFVSSIKYVLNPENVSGTLALIYDVIANAKEYYDGTITDFSQVGVKALNKYTVQYTLADPCPYFMRICNDLPFLPVNQKFLDEMGDSFGTEADTILYNGAYFITQMVPADTLIFSRNENYWDKENIYIDEIRELYLKDWTIMGELFQRGELDQASILPAEFVEEWVKDEDGKGKWAVKGPLKPLIWCYVLDFDPTYEGNGVEDFKIAVNNENFRKAIYHGMDKIALNMVFEPFDPQSKVVNTLTPPKMLFNDGKDYHDLEPIKDIAHTPSFNPDLALEYKAKAMQDLESQVQFPIKVLCPYCTVATTETQASQVLEQQLENLLGVDFIDIVLDGRPAPNYVTLTYDSRDFGITMVGFDGTFVDPAAFLRPGDPNSTDSYSKIHESKEYIDVDGVHQFVKLYEAGKAEKVDIDRRWNMLAQAEAFLLEHALIIPFMQNGGVWYLTRLDPFTGINTPFGRGTTNFKKVKMLDEPLTREGYQKALEQYLKECEEALQNIDHIQN